MSSSSIHARAVDVARRYRKCEIELIEVLQEVDAGRVFTCLGYPSLFKYCCEALGLSEEVTYAFIGVARKARAVPALQEELRSGRLSVSKAKRIVPVLNQSNQSEWLKLASTASKREIEKRVARAAPRTSDRLSYSAGPRDKVLQREARVQLQVDVSEDVMLKLRRAQDILSSKRQQSVGLEETLSALLDSYIRKEDPVEKAKRSHIAGRLAPQKSTPAELTDTPSGDQNPTLALATARSAKPTSNAGTRHTAKLGPGTVRRPIAAKIKHQVFLKFGGQCAFERNGKRCGQRRFLHIHHRVPIASGGTNEISNLLLLCSGHHRVEHRDGS